VALVALRLQLRPLVDGLGEQLVLALEDRPQGRLGLPLRECLGALELHVEQGALDAEVGDPLQLAAPAQAGAQAIIHLVGSHWYQRMPLR
jgi:hypothetical protein